ncbi:hypothetical protein ebA1600 [Aromatoleum aromaticum EbN1]|uniref:Uncharacterized protein n=1 Tax=Aromatoleum aromaticum (strain DSM 19018 / LMG 30748 / EbN1) TaxID=76114 RepID=Q5P6R5_AROAE|nr:hypothetical protein ebA1600 [Aromatoleum aromaticum EbN1]
MFFSSCKRRSRRVRCIFTTLARLEQPPLTLHPHPALRHDALDEAFRRCLYATRAVVRGLHLDLAGICRRTFHFQHAGGAETRARRAGADPVLIIHHIAVGRREETVGGLEVLGDQCVEAGLGALRHCFFRRSRRDGRAGRQQGERQ